MQRIGVAYVDTPEAREALRVARGLADRIGAGLRLFTVVAPRAEVFAPLLGRDAEEAFMATLREGAQAALDDREIDLLVCGSRGYGPVRRVLLGGVSSRLIRRAACPVVVVPRCAA